MKIRKVEEQPMKLHTKDGPKLRIRAKGKTKSDESPQSKEVSAFWFEAEGGVLYCLHTGKEAAASYHG